MTDIKKEALALYKPPFRFEYGYIFDSEGQMVADNHTEGEDATLRIRGWGRIQYKENPEELQDAVGAVIAEALTAYWNKE